MSHTPSHAKPAPANRSGRSSGRSAGRRPAAKLLVLRRFAGDESGMLSLFGLLILLVVLMAGGMAADILRYEYQRVRLQSTADRAVLAAGSLRQPNNPADVVAEYFAKEGLSQYLKSVDVDEGLNFRTVSVTTEAIVPAAFMRLVGVNSLTATAAARAEERYSKVEVSLVLDLSNSMNSYSRIENLRVAGGQFVEALFENSEEDQISVTVVNYTGQVNAGADLLQYYNVSQTQPFSHCVEFGASDYDSMSLPPGSSFVGAGHFDPWHTSRARNMIFCPSARLPQFSLTDNTSRDNIIKSGDPEFLTEYLENLWADGNTSIEIGLRWGAAFLDPSTRPIVDDMIDRGLVNPAFSGRPLDYDDEEALKVVVLMTDGENFVQWIINDTYKTGQSNIWHTVFYDQVPAQGGRLSLQDEVIGLLNGSITATPLQQHRFEALSVPMSNPQGLIATMPNRNLGSSGNHLNNNRVYLAVQRHNDGAPFQNWDFYLPSPTATNPGNSGQFHGSPWGWTSNLPNSGSWSVPSATSCFYHPATNTQLLFDVIRCGDRVAYRMTWPWVWDNFPVRWVAQRLQGPGTNMTANQFISAVLSTRSASVKNQHLDRMCDTIKENDIPIFTVAFEAPPGGVSAMQSCASSLNHFYDVAGTDIAVAFRAIAGTINRLRLTQ